MLTFVGQRVYGLCFYVKKMSSIGFSERPLYWCLIVLALNFCGTIFYSSIIFCFFKPLQAKELTKLNFHKNAEGEFIPGEEISNIELYVSYILAA